MNVLYGCNVMYLLEINLMHYFMSNNDLEKCSKIAYPILAQHFLELPEMAELSFF
jgi:hypothetical protein